MTQCGDRRIDMHCNNNNNNFWVSSKIYHSFLIAMFSSQVQHARHVHWQRKGLFGCKWILQFGKCRLGGWGRSGRGLAWSRGCNSSKLLRESKKVSRGYTFVKIFLKTLKFGVDYYDLYKQYEYSNTGKYLLRKIPPRQLRMNRTSIVTPL